VTPERLMQAVDILRTTWRHRSLVFELVKREFFGRYHGPFGGILWSVAQPVFLLAVYTLAFGVIGDWRRRGIRLDRAAAH